MNTALRFVSLALLCLAAPLSAQTNLTVYDDALEGGWQNWSWASVDLANTTTVHSGSDSIAVTANGWSALSLRQTPFNTAGYGNLTFWINGGATGGQKLNVQGTLNDSAQPGGVVIGPLAANTWQQITIPLASLGIDNRSNCTGFWIQEWTGNNQPTFYVDDVIITGSQPVIPPPPLVGMALYQDSFVNGWQNWSWATVNAGNTNPVNSGTSSIAVNSGPYQALRFNHSAMSTVPYSSLTFWINGGSTGGQKLNVQALLNFNAQAPVVIGPLAANTWQKITIPLAQLGAAGQPNLTDIWFQEGQGQTLPTYYVDDVRLDLAPAPATVSVTIDNRHRLRKVDPRVFGVNTAIWDGSFGTPTTVGLLNEIHNQALRFPGGSASDLYHWQTNTSDGQSFNWATNFDTFASVAQATHAQVFITANYGTGTPEEAAAWVTYANRTNHFGFQYWEIGNENYGTWEADHNTRPNDPVTYAQRFAQYYAAMKAADPTIKVGAVMVTGEDANANYSDESVTNPRTGQAHSGWSPVMLATLKQIGCLPDFVIYHRYEQGPGGENDTFLLTSAQSWPNDAASLRQLLSDYLGAGSARVEIDCTENNSVYGNPGKQTTSLVNGLFLADSIGNLLPTEFNSLLWWDLRNGQETGNNNRPLLYGWRNYGDYGLVTGATPAGPADRYPTFYVDKLLAGFARGGEQVLATASNYWGLGAYAVRGTAGTVNILLINKHPTSAPKVNLSWAGWTARGKVQVYQYGIAQDDAARTGNGSADVQQSSFNAVGASVSFTPPPYSATVLVVPGADN